MGRKGSYFNATTTPAVKIIIAVITINISTKCKVDKPSIFSEDLIIQGDIKNAGVLEIKGKVKGSINGGSITIREGGKVEGQVNVDSITIHGSFNGDLQAKTINISKGAKIIGKVKTLELTAEEYEVK